MKQWYSAVLKPRSGMSAANTAAPAVCTILCLTYVNVTRLQAAAQARQRRAAYVPGLLEITSACTHPEQSWESDEQALEGMNWA